MGNWKKNKTMHRLLLQSVYNNKKVENSGINRRSFSNWCWQKHTVSISQIWISTTKVHWNQLDQLSPFLSAPRHPDWTLRLPSRGTWLLNSFMQLSNLTCYKQVWDVYSKQEIPWNLLQKYQLLKLKRLFANKITSLHTQLLWNHYFQRLQKSTAMSLSSKKYYSI